jgi:hypothetical protein
MNTIHVNFNGGINTPLMEGRVDFEQYRSGCLQLENFVIRPYGGAFKAPGTQYIGATKDSAKKSRLFPVRISRTENYLLEVGEGYIRFWREDEPAYLQIKSDYSVPAHSTSTTYLLGDFASSGGTNYLRVGNNNAKDSSFATALAAGYWHALTGSIVEWPNSYDEDELNDIQFQQINRLLVLVHPNHPPLLIESIPVDSLSSNFIRNAAWSTATTTALTYSFLVGVAKYTFPPLKEHELSQESGYTVTLSFTHAAWATTTAYAVGDIRISSSVAYYCIVAHTSGTFATDLAAAKWRVATGQEVEYNLTASDADIFTGIDAGDSFIIEPALYQYSSSSSARGVSIDLNTTGNDTAIPPTASIFIQGGYTISSSWVSNNAPVCAIRLEQSLDGVNFEVIKEWNIKGEYQGTILYEDTASLEGSWFRLAGWSTTPKQFASVLLEASDAQVKLPFTVLSLTSSTVLKVRSGLPYTAIAPAQALGIAATSFFTHAFSEDNGYPGAVGLHNLRLWFGGTAKEPNRIRGSVVDDFFNFATGEGDSDGFDLVLNSNESNLVKWIASFRQGLVVGTGGEEWTIQGGGDGSEVLKPSNVQAIRRNRAGSSNIQPIQTRDSLLWVSPTGRKVFEFAYVFTSDAYEAPDMTLRAENVTESGIIATAYQSEPDPILWAVTADGRLLGFSYQRANQITAWFQRTTSGTFESIAVVRGSGDADRVWMIVNRTVNGATVRYIERFYPTAQEYDFSTATDFCYLDCAKKITMSSGTAVSGLSHLEGKAVKVWADGDTIENKTVSGGAITLSAAATTLFVGLAYSSTLQAMPLEFVLQDGTAQGHKFNAQRMQTLLYKSLGGQYKSTSGGTLYSLEYPAGTTAVFSGRKDQHLKADWVDAISLTFVHSDPTPFNMLGYVLKSEISKQ